MRPTVPLILVAALAAGALSACGAGSASHPDTVKVAYQRNTNSKVRYTDDYLAMVKKEFEKAHQGKKIQLIPIQAAENDYYAKIQQMMRSPKTSPDLVYEDTFLINSDIKSGYLRPLDDKLARWADWKRFAPAAKSATKAEDGKTYGVQDGTDTRALWYNKEIFAKAGLPATWQPKTWQDVLDTARTIKRKVPGVTPLNVYTGKGAGEASVMQTFEMLLYGTGEDPLYDPAAKKWVTGSKGFRDSLDFVRSVYAEKLGPELSDALDPNVAVRNVSEWLPAGKVGIDLDGSWLGEYWLPTGGKPWPQWSKVMAQTPFPTQHGQAPGKVSLSGGWAWSIPAKSRNADLAWQVIETLQSKRNAVEWDIRGAQIAVRDDVAADAKYLKSMPGIDFFTSLVKYSHFRPALPVYPRVSAAIGEQMENVTTGDSSVAEAAKAYDEQVSSITDGAVVSRK